MRKELPGSRSADELVAEIALGIDHVAADHQAQFLAELADVSLDHDLVDVMVGVIPGYTQSYGLP